MNRTENNRDVMEIVLIVLLTFVIVFLLRSSFNRRSNNVVIKVSATKIPSFFVPAGRFWS